MRLKQEKAEVLARRQKYIVNFRELQTMYQEKCIPHKRLKCNHFYDIKDCEISDYLGASSDDSDKEDVSADGDDIMEERS